MMIGYDTITCCSKGCGISFAVPARWNEERRNDHETFYCPNGHRQWYRPGTSPEEKLRLERDRLAQRIAEKDDDIKHQRDARQAAERSAAAYKGKVTRIKNRVTGGVCPCCNRFFSGLHRHMATKHKDYNKEAV